MMSLVRKTMPFGLLMLSLAMSATTPAQAQTESLSLKSNFRVGDSGVACRAQYRATDTRLMSLFDRSYQIVCRDAAAPVAELLVLRTDRDNDVEGTAQQLIAPYRCEAATDSTLPAGGSASKSLCADPDNGVTHIAYRAEGDDILYLARGLAGYDSAVQLALAALITDRRVPGKVEVATTAAGDPAAFARIRAGTLDDTAARAQAYELSSSGNFSDAEAFFGSLAERQTNDPALAAEFVANQGLQQSNLGNFVAARSYFDRASRMVPAGDGVLQRLIRNYRAINWLNQGIGDAAIEALDAPVSPPSDRLVYSSIGEGLIAEALARELNRENKSLQQLGGISSGLTEVDRAAILDAQAMQLRGSAQRTMGQLSEAEQSIRQAIEQYGTLRNGLLAGSTAPMRMQAQHDLSLILEQDGRVAEAREILVNALTFLESNYPQAPTPLYTKSWLAAFDARQGNVDSALSLYQEIVTEGGAIPGARAAMKDLLPSYFALLTERADSDPTAGPQLYRAAQLLQRPGVAQTQAVLARELSGGNNKAASLFRLSLNRSRTIARTSADVEALSAMEDLDPAGQRRLAEARDSLAALQREQIALQSQLAEFSQYRSLTSDQLDLETLQGLLKSGEAYYKVSFVGDAAYAQLIEAQSLRTFRLDADRYQLENMVANIRATIAVEENGRIVTYPYDLETARALYLTLFEPVESEMQRVTHLIYEPDGPLLQLPPSLLPQDQETVDSYLARADSENGDAFDFRGVNWLGRDRSVSISVSQRSFADLREIAPSRASRAYLGLGQNAKPQPSLMPASYSPASLSDDDCRWPLSTWNKPIAADELYLAQSILGQGESVVLTDDLFTDSNLSAKQDLSDFRIVHFATHGLVTAPRPNCPARPALVTSFGEDEKSDGLLSFTEIFDLRLDADLVVLSACDTAGAATAQITREAGIATGGNYALDGLVRAFAGAGARSVLASHWPVPDDFDATKQLISGLFSAGAGQSIGNSLRQATIPLMDRASTSHPYYWAAFILVGDAEKSLR